MYFGGSTTKIHPHTLYATEIPKDLIFVLLEHLVGHLLDFCKRENVPLRTQPPDELEKDLHQLMCCRSMIT